MADKEIREYNQQTTVDSADKFLMQDGTTNQTKYAEKIDILTNVPSEGLDVTIAFRGTSTQSIANSASATAVTTYSEVFDLGANFDPVTGLFTAPLSGYYCFVGIAGFTNLTASSRMGVFVITSGGQRASQQQSNTSSLYDPVACCMLIASMTIGDTCQMSAFQDAGSFSLNTESSFSGYFIGV